MLELPGLLSKVDQTTSLDVIGLQGFSGSSIVELPRHELDRIELKQNKVKSLDLLH